MEGLILHRPSRVHVGKWLIFMNHSTTGEAAFRIYLALFARELKITAEEALIDKHQERGEAWIITDAKPAAGASYCSLIEEGKELQ